MVGKDEVVCEELLNSAEESYEFFWVVKVGSGLAHLIKNLREGGAAEAVLTRSQVEEDEGAIA